METHYSGSNTSRYIHGAFLGIALAASFASGLFTGINITDLIRQERSSENRKCYVLDLEGKVQPGNYDIRTEESDVCKIIADNVQVISGNYKLMFIETAKQLEQQQSTFAQLELHTTSPTLSSNPLRPEEKGDLPYVIPGTNKLDPTEAKKFGLPAEGYIVKPHPYKQGNFIFIKDIDSEKFENFKTSLKIVNGSSGNVCYSVQVRGSRGDLLREYIEPSDEKYELNPDKKSDKPQFHSTTPIFKNPDGSIDAYRPLKEGESLEEVMKKGPVERYVPSSK